MVQEKLTLEKLKINERLLMIEEYIRQGKDQRAAINETMGTLNLRMSNIEFKVLGDPKKSEKKDRDGLERRLEQCEDKDKKVEKIEGRALQIAVGAATMAIGAFVIWAWKMMWAGINMFHK